MNLRPVLIAFALVAAWSLATAAPGNKKPKKKPHSVKQAAAPGPGYARRKDVMLAADDIAARRDLNRKAVRRAIAQAHYIPLIAKLILPPTVGTPKNWRLYRSRFIEPIRIKAGVRFWQDNLDALTRAEQETGVPAEIIVGIIGVETIYGQQMGNYRVIDALATLAFDFPAAHPRALERSAFFKAELEQFLSLTQRTGVDPLSWACPNSCHRAGPASQSISMATAGLTSSTVRLMRLDRWPTISRLSTGNRVCRRTTRSALTRQHLIWRA